MQCVDESHQAGKNVIAYSLRSNRYLNLTNRCTLRCRFCPKFNKQWDVESYSLRLREEPDVSCILNEVGAVGEYEQVVFCGLGEPTLRLPELLEVASGLKRQGAFVRVNTDGLANFIHGRDVTPQLADCVDALSISLNAQDESTYNYHCRPPREGAYPEMLEFILRAKAHIPEITLTAVDGLDGVDVGACRDLAHRFGVQFRRRVLGKVGV